MVVVMSPDASTDDIDAVRGWAVEDDVVADRETAQVRRQLRPIASSLRIIRQHLDGAVDAPEERGRRGFVIVSNVVPYLDKVFAGLRAARLAIWHECRPPCVAWPRR